MPRSWNRDTGCPMHCFSLVVCRHPEQKNKWLAVEESNSRGWWLPGGFVECGDDHFSAAIRETKEEAGIDVELKGVLRVENQMSSHGGRQRVVFYAEPKDLSQAEPKQEADKESLSAAWLTAEELEAKSSLKPAEGGLRGEELLQWAKYIENDGTIYPLAMFATEDTPIPFGPPLEMATVGADGKAFLDWVHKANEKNVS